MKNTHLGLIWVIVCCFLTTEISSQSIYQISSATMRSSGGPALVSEVSVSQPKSGVAQGVAAGVLHLGNARGGAVAGGSGVYEPFCNASPSAGLELSMRRANNPYDGQIDDEDGGAGDGREGDVYRSNESPVGSAWVLLLFALAAAMLRWKKSLVLINRS